MKKQIVNERNDQDYRLFALASQLAGNAPWVTLTYEIVCNALSLAPRQVFLLFSRLNRQGRIQKLQKGLYILPSRLPPGKKWKPSAYEALSACMSFFNTTWQITGLDALARYGFTTQITQEILVYNDRLSGKKTIAGSRFVFIKLSKNKLGNVTSFLAPNNLQINYSSKNRTLFDCVFEATRLKTLPEAYTWIASISDEKESIQEIIECCLLYGNKQTNARLGFFLDKLGCDTSTLHAHFSATSLKNFVTFTPGGRVGPIDNKWNIIENFSVSEILSKVEVPDADDDK